MYFFSDGPYEWVDGSEAKFQNWAPGEPNDIDGTESCGQMYIDLFPGMWNDHDCSQADYFVCKTPKGIMT